MRARRFGAVALTMALCTPGAAFAAPDSVHPVKMALGGGYQEAPGDLVKRKASHRDRMERCQRGADALRSCRLPSGIPRWSPRGGCSSVG